MPATARRRCLRTRDDRERANSHRAARRSRRAPSDLLPAHLRLPDERARLGAHPGHARERGPAPRRESRRSRRAGVQHLHGAAERRRAPRRSSGHRRPAQARRPRAPRRGDRLPAAGRAGRLLLALPLRRRGPRAPESRSPARGSARRPPRAAWLLRRRALAERAAPRPPRAALPGLAAGHGRLHQLLLLLRRALRARPRTQPAAARGRRRGASAGGRRGARAHAPRAERQRLRGRPLAQWRWADLRGAARAPSTASRASRGSVS